MSSEGALTWLLQGAVATSASLLLVLVLRAPLRRGFGARVAYAAWALVPLALLAVSLPGPQRETAVAHWLPRLAPAVLVGPATPVGAGDAMIDAGAFDWQLALVLAWVAGAVALALRFCRQQRRFVAGLGALDARGDGTYAADTEQCPVVIGAWRPRIVLPADFDARYPLLQAALVIAHERTHVARGDVRANLALAMLRCLHWFNPLLHAAAGRFRLDQELACDAAVLARHPNARRAYADAMLNTQLAVPGLPVGCHWQSSQVLKERILMLKQPLPGRWRQRAGTTVVVVALATSSYAAWAMRPTVSEIDPTYKGYVDEEGVAIATVSAPDGAPISVTGAAMSATPGGRNVNVVLRPGGDFEMQSLAPEPPWSIRIAARGSAAAPLVTWSLSQNGKRVNESTIPLPEGRAVALDLSALTDAEGRKVTVVLNRMPADRIVDVTSYGDPSGRSLVGQRDADGAYRQAEAIRVYSDQFKVNGTATLLVGVGINGHVRTVDVETVTPAVALSGVQADELVRRNVYVPQQINGRPVATRIRVPVAFSHDMPDLPAPPPAPAPAPAPPSPSPSPPPPTPTPPMPALAEPAPAIGAATVAALASPVAQTSAPARLAVIRSSRRSPAASMADAAKPVKTKAPTYPDGSARTPAPRYPPDAVSKQQRGRVVLVVDVDADGTVKDVAVESAEPAGVFDTVSLEAARQWRFTPTMKDGKAVEGRVRVPIDFDPKGQQAVPGVAGDKSTQA